MKTTPVSPAIVPVSAPAGPTGNMRRSGLRQFFRAYAEWKRFHALDSDQRRDLGLTQTDTQNATFSEFLAQPRR